MAYFQQSIVTPALAENRINDALIEAIAGTRALNRLFYHYNASTDCAGDGEYAEGAERLLEQQCLILAGIQNAIEAEQDAREAEALAAAEAAKATDVRRAFILAQAKAGVEPKVIAEALNMKIGNVAAVLASAVEESPR